MRELLPDIFSRACSSEPLLELDFDAVLVGDGVAILEGARERVREPVAAFPTD